LLKPTQSQFQQFIADEIELNKPKYNIISSIDQRLLDSPKEISSELTDNLFRRINWMDSFDKMLMTGTKRFVECGAGKSLQRISRFIPGDFKVYPMNKVVQLLA